MALKTDIPYNHREQLMMVFDSVNSGGAFPVENYQYSFGFNQNIGSGKTYRIVWYQPNNLLLLDGYTASTQVINGKGYVVPPIAEDVLVTFARRGGGFYCIDKPLGSFLVNTIGSTGHFSMELNDWEIDTTQSYIKFSTSVALQRFLVILFLDLRPQ